MTTTEKTEINPPSGNAGDHVMVRGSEVGVEEEDDGIEGEARQEEHHHIDVV